MKKNVFTILTAVLLAATGMQAQFQKGDRLLSGAFSANYSGTETAPGREYISNAAITPGFAWFIKDNLAFGVRGGISAGSSRQYPSSQSTYKSTGIGLSPGVFLTRFKTIKNKLGFMFTHELYGVFNEQTYRQQGIKTTNTSRGAGYEFAPGIFYRFGENFMGTARAGSVYANWQRSSGNDQFSAGISFMRSFQLGVAYRFTKKSKAGS